MREFGEGGAVIPNAWSATRPSAMVARMTDALRARVTVERAINVVHIDLPHNDFSTLFETLKNNSLSYLKTDPAAFAYAVGRSYFEQLLPSNSVTLVRSARTLRSSSSVPSRRKRWPTGDRAAAQTLSRIGLLSRKDFAACLVENPQSDRSRRPRDIGRGDDRFRHVRDLNLDLRQSGRPAIRRRADKLDSEWVRGGGGHRGQLIGRPGPGRGSGPARREPSKESRPWPSGVCTIGNENGIHRQPNQRVDVRAAANQACNRQCDKTPIRRD